MNIKRLDKIIASQYGISRSITKAIIHRGKVKIDGAVVRDPSLQVDIDAVSIEYKGQVLNYKEHIYIIMNKPKGVLSASEDKSRETVVDLVPKELSRQGLFPVGRLDRDTVGLMILTNNGQLAHSLLSPKHHVAKEYYFTSAEPLDADAESAFIEGITLAGGYECKPAELYLDEGRREGRIVLTEGKYHQIKRMIASRDNRVTSLERISFGGIPLDKSLARGEWRYLTDEEISLLEKQA